MSDVVKGILALLFTVSLFVSGFRIGEERGRRGADRWYAEHEPLPKAFTFHSDDGNECFAFDIQEDGSAQVVCRVSY